MVRLNADIQGFFGSDTSTRAAHIISSALHFQDLTSLLAMLPSSENVGQGGGLRVSRPLARDSVTRDLELLIEVLLAVCLSFDGPTVSAVCSYLFLSQIVAGHMFSEPHLHISP